MMQAHLVADSPRCSPVSLKEGERIQALFTGTELWLQLKGSDTVLEQVMDNAVDVEFTPAKKKALQRDRDGELNVWLQPSAGENLTDIARVNLPSCHRGVQWVWLKAQGAQDDASGEWQMIHAHSSADNAARPCR